MFKKLRTWYKPILLYLPHMTISNQTHDVSIKNYSPLEIIVSEGDAQDFFYVILDGTVNKSEP